MNIEDARDKWEQMGILDGYYGDKNNLVLALENQRNHNLNVDSARFRRMSIPMVFGIFANNTDLVASDEECKEGFVSSVNINDFSEDIEEEPKVIAEMVRKLSEELNRFEYFHLIELDNEGFVVARVS